MGFSSTNHWCFWHSFKPTKVDILTWLTWNRVFLLAPSYKMYGDFFSLPGLLIVFHWNSITLFVNLLQSYSQMDYILLGLEKMEGLSRHLPFLALKSLFLVKFLLRLREMMFPLRRRLMMVSFSYARQLVNVLWNFIFTLGIL
jgi:hypothetical protein